MPTIDDWKASRQLLKDGETQLAVIDTAKHSVQNQLGTLAEKLLDIATAADESATLAAIEAAKPHLYNVKLAMSSLGPALLGALNELATFEGAVDNLLDGYTPPESEQ